MQTSFQSIGAAQLSGNPLGGWGNVVDNPFLLVTSQVRFGNTRCADSVVLVPVVQAWYEGPWCGVPGVPSVLICWASFRSWRVVRA